MPKDNNEAAKLELIAQLLSTKAQETEEPKGKKKSKRAGTPVSKTATSKAKKQKAAEAELRKHMAKPRSEELGGKK